jgi:hypothetical protein
VVIQTEELAEARVAMTSHDGRDVVAFHQTGTSSALDAQYVFEGRDVGATGVFVAEVDGIPLTFEAAEVGQFVDNETGSTWDLFGRAVAGPLAGSTLEGVEHLDTFWFAIAAFAPEATIVRLT